MWQRYVHAGKIEDALNLLSAEGANARVMAGGTDLVLEYRNEQRETVQTVIDISRIPGLGKISFNEGWITLDAMVTHSDCVASQLLYESAYPLVQACESIGAPQIRNRGTVIGNLVTASPANDTIPVLAAFNAELTVQSVRGSRKVKLSEFYKGVRRTVLEPDEMVTSVSFRALEKNERGLFLKHALRNVQAISLVNACIVVDTANDGTVSRVEITLGAVAPVIIHAIETEKLLLGKVINQEIIHQAAALATDEANPISDVRCSAAYRKAIIGVLIERGLTQLINQNSPKSGHIRPVVLWGQSTNPLHDCDLQREGFYACGDDEPFELVVEVNGKEFRTSQGYGKTLLQMLRDDFGLMGTKEGCGEGECGSCTVYLNGAAVLSCLIPAERAHGSSITTIEGLAEGDELNGVQQAFVENGAVQCGFCTPGFVMSATKLLEEIEKPTLDQIKAGISGNLCRCTGYYKIVKAIESAAEK